MLLVPRVLKCILAGLPRLIISASHPLRANNPQYQHKPRYTVCKSHAGPFPFEQDVAALLLLSCPEVDVGLFKSTSAKAFLHSISQSYTRFQYVAMLSIRIW